MRAININKVGQSIVEYALLLSIVAAAIGAMSLYVQRSVQANVKVIENQVNGHASNPLE